MYYVYLLRSGRNGRFYIGQSSDLRQRLNSHNNGENIATKSGVPWHLVYYEAYPTRQDAVNREQKLKHHGKGLAELKKRLSLVKN